MAVSYQYRICTNLSDSFGLPDGNAEDIPCYQLWDADRLEEHVKQAAFIRLRHCVDMISPDNMARNVEDME